MHENVYAMAPASGNFHTISAVSIIAPVFTSDAWQDSKMVLNEHDAGAGSTWSGTPELVIIGWRYRS